MSVQVLPFQREAIVAVEDDWATGMHTLLVSLPTGAGKTIVGSEIARRHLTTHATPVLFLVHSDEILSQTVEKIHLVYDDASVGVIQQTRVEWHHPVVVASVWTLARHCAELPFIGLVISDEAHHAEARTWRDIYTAVGQRNPHFLHLGLTATPFRQDKQGQERGLAGIFERLSYSRSMFDLIAAGYLVHLRGICISIGTRLDAVRTHGEDFEEASLATMVNTPTRNQLVVESYHTYCPGRKAICFAVNVAHAQALMRAFCQRGIPAATLLGDIRIEERREIRQRFRTGDISALCTCGVVNEGYDEPSAEVSILARPTRSRRLYIQQAGRVARQWPSKTEGIVLDLVDATQRHRLVSMRELLTFYGLRHAEVQLAETTASSPRTDAVRAYGLTPHTISQIQSLAALSPIVREVDLFRLDAFAWHRAQNGSAYVTTLYDGAELGVVATEGEDLFDVVATFREGVFVRLLAQPTTLENALGCANAYVFDFGDWRLALRRAQWRTAVPTPGQQAALTRAWATRSDEMRRIVGDDRRPACRGDASGVISTVLVLRTIRTGTEENRTWALARFRERYGSERHDHRILDVTGSSDSPLVAALRRYYVELSQRQRTSFADFLCRTLERCTLHIEDTRLTVTGNAQTATYTAKQWTTIGEVLTRELSRVGDVEVVVVPPRDRDWIRSQPYRVLWQAVVTELALPSTQPIVVTGLPVWYYGTDRIVLEELVHQVFHAYNLRPRAVIVVPQPFGSFFDRILDRHGRLSSERDPDVHLGIIDIGHFTTDFVEV
jgi:superfamily II DNA or RNA helicase